MALFPYFDRCIRFPFFLILNPLSLLSSCFQIIHGTFPPTYFNLSFHTACREICMNLNRDLNATLNLQLLNIRPNPVLSSSPFKPSNCYPFHLIPPTKPIARASMLSIQSFTNTKPRASRHVAGPLVEYHP